ncbi:MAG: hypothetical protein EBT92_09180 [Planctomycetes bacterium]|nr:hypothetical protein [Planctomycetota bacterium]NBY01080.1 hypothetical protein [Planctomycetota bacterium]
MYSVLILATGLGLAQAEEIKNVKSIQVQNNISFRVQTSQELLYRGLFTEEARSSRVQFQRSYRIESRCLVLETNKNNSQLACLTLLKQRTNPASLPTVTSEPPATSVRLETFICDSKGKIQPGNNLGKLSLEGPSTIEYGYLIELPKNRIAENDTWETTEDGRPVCIWIVSGTEMVQGVKCIKLIGTQQTEDWLKTRADRQAWKRTDTVWLHPQMGVAQKLERTIEIKDPAHNEPSQKSTLRLELETSLVYPGQLFLDRKNEIQLATNYRESANSYTQEIAKYSAQIKSLIRQVKSQSEIMSQTPYRDAIIQTTKRLENFLKGENSETVIVPVSATSLQTAKLGQKAPDFIAQNMLKQESVRLARLEGKSILLVFYNPKSPLSNEILSFAKTMQANHGDSVTVLGMSVIDDNEIVKKQAEASKINFDVLNGSGLRSSYGLESTPKIVLLDAKGIVRLNCLGWGQETQSEINSELKRNIDKD